MEKFKIDQKIMAHNIQYVVKRVTLVPGYEERYSLIAMRPKGKKRYCIVAYETGEFSQAVTLS